ncbi:hypothetical protein ACG7TL_005674 [Trametes sanguinea]
MADSVPPTHPFTHPSADIIFCSSDGVLFKVHKLVLSLASEFFADMFALPQPAAPSSTGLSTEPIESGKVPTELEGLPVVHVSEPGTVLEDLFRLVYPFADPSLVKFDRVRSVFEAALKYQMHEAIAITTRRLLDLAPTEPLRVYAIACLHSLTDVVTAAARAVFDQQLMDKYVDELEEIPVSAYRRLLSYCGSSQATGKRKKLNGPFPASLNLEYSDLASVTPSIKPTDVDDAYDSVFPSDVEDFGSVASDTPNVIIRTCDEQDIKFSADMLRVFSPVLAASLSITSSRSLETPRVITVPEPCDIMRPLLAMYHLLALPPALDAPALVSALVAAEKYQMKKAVWLLRDALSKLEADPSVDVVWLYFVACRFSMRSLAHAAARRCLRLQDLATSSFANVDFPGVMSEEETCEELDGLPVIQVPEPRDVLECLFRLCYPIDDPPLNTVDEVRSTLEAAMKYQMREATSILTRRLLAQAKSAPLRVFAIAHRLSLEDVVAAAARAVSKQKAQDMYVVELEEIPVHIYYRLLSYCARGGGSSSWTTSSNHPNLSSDSESARVQASSSPPPPSLLPPVFDREGADVVIRTADDVEFGVSKDILRIASPVLFERFSSSTAPFDSPPPPPTNTITVPETSDVMLALLYACYPIVPPPLTDLPLIVAAFAAAEKYRMDSAIWRSRECLVRLKQDPSSDPLMMYFVACRLGLRDLATDAARKTLQRDLFDETESIKFPDVDSFGVSAGHLWRLLDYHRRCRSAMRSVVDSDPSSWMSEEWKQKVKICNRNFSLANACWFNPYLTSMRGKAWPSSADARSESVFNGSMFNVSCSYCEGRGVATLFSFAMYVEETLKARESEVPLEWKDIDVQTDAPGQSSSAESVLSV